MIYFEKNQPLHIVSRAVEERKIFKNKEDCDRFIFQMYAANVGRPSFNLWRKNTSKVAQELLSGKEPPSGVIIKGHSPFVNILSFALVMNHYHLFITANREEAIPLYMKKLNIGFAKYYNFKNNRRGALFGARYKAVPIQSELQFDAVIRYINIINVLDVFQVGWREKGLKNWRNAFNFLKRYPYSSFPDLVGERRSKILASPKVFKKFSLKRDLGSESLFTQFTKDFLIKSLEVPDKVFLD